MVTPVARALALLGAFTPLERWLGNRDLQERTGMPSSTVSRIAQSLVTQGFLHYAPVERKYRLSAAVLTLGYGALANSEVQRIARSRMHEFADRHRVHLVLGARGRLDLVVLESCSPPPMTAPPNLHVGARLSLASSPMGWALLASLPEAERELLIGSLERRVSREEPRLRRRVAEAIAQVHDRGFCVAAVDAAGVSVIAAPIDIPGQPPRVLGCIGSPAQLGRARIDRELGPSLLATVLLLRQAGGGS
jgi:DNA-binding IclR family transcriptional regulator